MELQIVERTVPNGETGKTLQVTGGSSAMTDTVELVSLPYPPDRSMIFSVWATASAETPIMVNVLGSNGYFTIGTGWTRLYLSAAEPTGQTVMLILMSNATVYLYQAQLEMGEIPSDWKAAPEDDAEELDVVREAVLDLTPEHIVGYVTSSDPFRELVGQVTILDGEVSAKASQTSVNSLTGRVDTMQASIDLVPNQIRAAVDDIEEFHSGSVISMTRDKVYIGTPEYEVEISDDPDFLQTHIKADFTHVGVTYTWDESTQTYDVDGTATATSYRKIAPITGREFPSWIVPGGTYRVYYETPGNDVNLYIFFYNSTTTETAFSYVKADNSTWKEFTVPSNAVNWLVDLNVPNGRTVSHAKAGNFSLKNVGIPQNFHMDRLGASMGNLTLTGGLNAPNAAEKYTNAASVTIGTGGTFESFAEFCNSVNNHVLPYDINATVLNDFYGPVDLSGLIGAASVSIDGGSHFFTQSDMESGYWGYSTPTPHPKRLRNKELLPVRKGSTFHYGDHQNARVYIGVLPSTTARSYLQTTGWIAKGTSGTVPINNDGYLVFLLEYDDNVTPEDFDVMSSFGTTIYGDVYFGNCMSHVVVKNIAITGTTTVANSTVSFQSVSFNGNDGDYALNETLGSCVDADACQFYRATSLIRVAVACQFRSSNLKGSGTNCIEAGQSTVYMNGTRPAGNIILFECLYPVDPNSLLVDYGGGTPVVTPTTTVSLACVNSGTHYPSGHWYGGGDKRIRQGFVNLGSSGNNELQGCMWFDITALSGHTVLSALLTLTRVAGYGRSSDVNVRLYTTPLTGPSGNPLTNAVDYGIIGAIANGETKQFAIPTAAVQALAGGTMSGLMLQIGDGALISGRTYSTNYAHFFGYGETTPPSLTVTYQ